MTIGKQLTLVFGFLTLVLLVLSYASLTAIGRLETTYNQTADKTFQKALLADAINTAESNMLAGQRGLVLYSTLDNAEMIGQSRTLFRTSADLVLRSVKDFRTLDPNDEARTLLDKIEADTASWNGVVAEVERLWRTGAADQAVGVATQRGFPIYQDLGRLAGRLNQIQSELVRSDRANAGAVATRSRWIATLLVVLGVIGGVVVTVIIRRINRTLQTLAHELDDGAGQLASAAAQVSSSSQTLAQGSSEQAASLEETSASSEEISSMTMKNSENSATAAENMTEAARRIEGANQSLGQMIGSMNEINASSGKISRIIKVIDEIAFQTNILALNAAVEAARAGDAGAGFAVVADEVRSLAQRCAQAARDTSTLIAESIEKSNEGKDRLAQVANDIQAITQSASTAKTLVDEVNQASREQAQGIAEVTRAINQMQQVTQQSAASAEESASAGEELSAQSEKLRGIVRSLTALVGAES